MTTPKLFTPIRAGDLDLKNRIAMAPLTRNRARHGDDAPYEIHAEYYAQRASAGLLITEATQISQEGQGYVWTPGIYTDAQIAGWRTVTDAVHEKGGKIVLQLWHVGRVSHTSLQPNGGAPVAPSAIRADTKTFIESGFAPVSEPRALDLAEIPRVIDDFRRGAENAHAAGFDGVEIHGANGYLLDQFLRDGTNTRADAYGGSVENRGRLLDEVTQAVVDVLGAGRVGVRLSPFSAANGASDSDPMSTFGHAIDRLNRYGLAYLHMVEGQTGGSRDLAEGQSVDALRARFDGVYIANNGYDRALAIDAVESGRADMVAFGRPYIANPDLVERLERDAPLNAPDQATFYGGGVEGYTDYPTLQESRAA